MIVLQTTIWLSLACYTATVCWLLVGERRDWRWPRVLWAVGCLLLLAHLAAAFHVVHHWRHAAAVADTARQTRALLGFAFGGGVWFNYLFAALWFADAAWWSLAPGSHRSRPRWIGYALHAYLFFLWINGAVIFVDGWARGIGLAAFLTIGVCGAISVRRRKDQAAID